MTNNLKRAIDTDLFRLCTTERERAMILDNALEGKKVKKKLSVGFVLVIVLILAAVTALAAALLWEQQVVPMKEIEQTHGYYMDWPLSQKEILIRALIDSGHIVESDETARLFANATAESEKHAIADQLVLTLTGQADVREISVDIITYAIMGSTDRWTPEQRVWWQQVTEQFYNDQGAPDTLIVPTEDVITEAEAIAIAKEALLEAYEWQPDALDKALTVADLYVTEQHPDYRRWSIQFKILREGSDSYVERVYSVVVDERGQVIDDPDFGIVTPKTAAQRPSYLPSGYPDTPLFRPINDLALRAGNKIFELWPLDLKAEFSQTVAPQVRAIVESGDLSLLDHGGEPNLDVVAFSTYTYGLPGEADISQEYAFALAKQALMATYHLDSETVELYDDPYFYFDITNQEERLWKIVFCASYASAAKFPDGFASGQGSLRYKVEINSQTGEVIKTEEFAIQIGGDLEYKLKAF